MSTILIVDDEDNVLEILTAILERSGHKVFGVKTADEAERALEKGPIDLMLIDVVLPGRGGLDLLMALRARHTALPVIVMSGKISPAGSDPFKNLASQFGAKCVLAKPFGAEELLAAVNAVLGQSCA